MYRLKENYKIKEIYMIAEILLILPIIQHQTIQISMPMTKVINFYKKKIIILAISITEKLLI
jgi:hypothetical protein